MAEKTKNVESIAGKLKQANLVNIAKKLQSGKTLTRFEAELLDKSQQEQEQQKSDRLFPSKKAACAATGIPPSVQKKLQDMGSKAFRAGGQVHEGQLLEDYAAHPELKLKPGVETKEEAELRLKQAKADMAEDERDEQRKQLVRFEQCKIAWGQHIQNIRTNLEAGLTKVILLADSESDVPRRTEGFRKIFDWITRNIHENPLGVYLEKK